MSQAKNPGWAMGCAAILVVAFIAIITCFFWWIITTSWLRWSLAICLALVGLAKIVFQVLAKSKTRRKLSQVHNRNSSTVELSTLEAEKPSSNEPVQIPAFDTYSYGYRSYLSSERVAALIADGMLVNGNSGGLLVGRAHSQGGVPVVRSRPDGSYEVWAEFEGYEYIINPGALVCFQKECEAANQHETDKRYWFTEYTPEPDITIIDVRAINHPAETKYLLLDDGPAFFIVNKFSTETRQHILEQMNRAVTYEQYLLAVEETRKKSNA